MNSLVFVFGLLAISFVGIQCCVLKYKDCGSKGATVLSVSDNATECGDVALLKRGTYLQLNITFTSKEVTSSLTADVHGKIGPASIPFPLGNPDACQNCNVKCPVQNGQMYSYLPAIEVKTSYPGISLVIEWGLIDQDKNDFICIVMPAKIE